MASTNQSPEYQRAEKHFLEAGSDEEKLVWLEEMIREAPKHKSSEKMNANLRTRYIKLKKKLETQKKSKKGGVKGIKKTDMQVVLVGFTNSGKSSLLKTLTNAKPKISQSEFTTKEPTIGTMDYQGLQIQIIDLPSINSENFDIGVANMSDLVIMVVTKKEEIEQIKNSLPKIRGKIFVAFNKIDSITQNEKRKISETLKSKKHNFILTSTITNEGIEELKEKILFSFDIARIYLKEPGKPQAVKPLVVKEGATLLEVAKKISKELASQIKEARIWGPSSKFANQRVGLKHKVKDKDIVEFHTR
tara:strand:+ start:496 stop:1407 length:912 start_codon:yes stop_codon:yes gene_type:complete